MIHEQQYGVSTVIIDPIKELTELSAVYKV